MFSKWNKYLNFFISVHTSGEACAPPNPFAFAGASPPYLPSLTSQNMHPVGHDTYTMIIVHACTMIIVHVACPPRRMLGAGATQVEGFGGAKPPWKARGFGGPPSSHCLMLATTLTLPPSPPSSPFNAKKSPSCF